MKEINITLPDNTTKSFSSGITPQDVADSIGSGLARAVVVAKVNGLLRDLNHKIHEDVTLELFTGDTPEGHDTLLHSTAHLMAQAVKELFPHVKITIGPTIENGFYYDFDLDQSFSDEILEKIENKMINLSRYLELPNPSFKNFLNWILELRKTLNIPHTLKELINDEANFNKMSEMAFPISPCTLLSYFGGTS